MQMKMQTETNQLINMFQSGRKEDVTDQQLNSLYQTLGNAEKLSHLEYDILNILDNHSLSLDDKKSAIQNVIDMNM